MYWMNLRVHFLEEFKNSKKLISLVNRLLFQYAIQGVVITKTNLKEKEVQMRHQPAFPNIKTLFFPWCLIHRYWFMIFCKM